MSDVIDFNELKNKVRDKDIDEFEAYIFKLVGDMGGGITNPMTFNKAILEYMKENQLSNEKFMEIQKKLMERYGMSMEDLNSQFHLDNNEDYKKYRKSLGFTDKYKSKLKEYTGYRYPISNERNQLQLYLSGRDVLITSTKKVDLSDNELNEFLVSYKKLQDEAKLNITISESGTTYEY